jgi:hypothetical protein
MENPLASPSLLPANARAIRASAPVRDRSLDWEFREAMQGEGEFRSCNVPLARFPWWAAGVLAAQTNEWALFGFARRGRVDFVWLNEGAPNHVLPGLTIQRACAVAVRHGYGTLLDVHNHPNLDPARFDCSGPSAQDLRAVRRLARFANAWEIEVVAFVCEHGIPYEYAYHALRNRGAQQLSFDRIPGFVGGTDWPAPMRGRDRAGRFLPSRTREAARGVWPRSPG